MRPNLLALGLSFFLFVVYLHTAGPSVYLGDSGELTAAAHCLGIPHNSGYPLFAALGKAFALIPFGNIAFRLNLMSAFLGAATVWLVCRVLSRITGSALAALSAAALLGVSPPFWGQTASAEVYPLHTFFIALLLALLEWWERDRAFFKLALFSLVAGLSFGNHLQTVMIAPAVFYFILSRDRAVLFSERRFLQLAGLFALPLIVYAYLPIRTQAGAAIHWGDPDTLNRFLAHVSASSHRSGYVFDQTLEGYFSRFLEALGILWNQFGVLLLIALWGAIVFRRRRWVLLSAMALLFDLFYTVALNTVSLQVTPFMLPGSIAVALLIGFGAGDLLSRVRRSDRVGLPLKKAFPGVLWLVPAFLLVSRIGLCDQSRNYTGYESAVNTFRTCETGAILFLGGDNHLFPVTYGRLVEFMRTDVHLFDRHNILFKMPYLGEGTRTLHGSWEDLRTLLEGLILRRARDRGIPLYYAVFDPVRVRLPSGYRLAMDGVLYRPVQMNGNSPARNPWAHYCFESFFEPFSRDYLTRQMTAHFFFHFGRAVFRAGNRDRGLALLERASRVGFDDTGIHSLIAAFLIEKGLLEEARDELLLATAHHDDPGVVHNNWGCYFFARGDYGRAAGAFREATEASPGNAFYHKNLGQALQRLGRRKDAMEAFRRSLTLRPDQPGLRIYLEGKSPVEGVQRQRWGGSLR